jgi:iron(III) transport system permease protein
MRRIFFPLMLPTFVGVFIWVILLSVRLAGIPLLLTDGPNNRVLATQIWLMWGEAQIEPVAAIAVLMILGLFLLVVIMRWLGFGGGLVQRQ